LYERKVGDLTIMVHALLLGGYVSFAEDDKDCDLPEDSPERFLNKSIWQRLVVVSAGVIANVICAYFLVLFSALVWHHLPSGSYDIDVTKIVAPQGASVWNSGLEVGDRIISINGTKVKNTSPILAMVQLSKRYDSYVDPHFVDANLVRLKKLNPALSADEIVPPDVAVRIPTILPEKPIQLNSNVARGIRPYKDNQYKINSRIIKLRDTIDGGSCYVSTGDYTLKEIAEAISDSIKPLNMIVKRDGKLITLKPIYPTKAGSVGIQFSSKEQLMKTTSFGKAVLSSCSYLTENTYVMLVGLKQAFTGEIPLADLHGIVAITKVGGDIIQNNGIFYGLLLTAIISMDLAIVNFLPIPALDGGHVLFLLIEKIRGKRVSDKVVEIIANVSFFILIGLMIFVIFNDIFALVTQKL
jgi:regulator of sigma E protease